MGRTARSPHRYTDEEIQRGLVAVAACSGNTRRAARELASQGLRVPRETLRSWATDVHSDAYLRVQRDVLPSVYGRIAERNEELVDALADIEWATIEKYREELPNLRASEAASSLRNVSVSKAVNLDKASVIRGRPTEIREQRDISDLLRALTEKWAAVIKGVTDPIEVEAEVEAMRDGEAARTEGLAAGPAE